MNKELLFMLEELLNDNRIKIEYKDNVMRRLDILKQNFEKFLDVPHQDIKGYGDLV